jgi:hypothetical protein
VAAKTIKKEIEVEKVMPSGTPYSHLTQQGLYDEYVRVMGKPALDLSLQQMIDELVFQFELQKTLSYQDEIYQELNKQEN